MRKTEVILLGLTALFFGIALSLYRYLPDEMPAGWDFKGNVRATMPKNVIVFSTPVLLLALMLIIMVSSRIRPSLQKKERFRTCSDRLAILIFLWYVCVLLQMVLWPLGLKVSLFFVFQTGIGVICFYFGVLFERAGKDSFIALRTRWTLSTEEVWNNTDSKKFSRACQDRQFAVANESCSGVRLSSSCSSYHIERISHEN